MAAAPWTVRFRERAFEAERRSHLASFKLDIAVRLLEPHRPMVVADVPGARSNAQFVLLTLNDAGSGLAFTAAAAAAAELLALRGAAADPTTPLPSAADIPDDAHLKEQVALGWLREARVHAEAAYDNIGRCCERLMTACNLLEHPGLPGVDGLLDAERAAAHGHLVVAEGLATVSNTCARGALHVLRS